MMPQVPPWFLDPSRARLRRCRCTLLAMVTVLALGCERDSPSSSGGAPPTPLNSPAPSNASPARSFRPADYLPPAIEASPAHPLPAPVDEYGVVDVYRGDRLVRKIVHADLPGSDWTQQQGAEEDPAGKGTSTRAGLDFDKLVDLRRLLEPLDLSACLEVRVLTLKGGVAIPQKMMLDPECRFYFVYNRRKLVKMIERRRVHETPGDEGRWAEFVVLREVSWVEVGERRAVEGS